MARGGKRENAGRKSGAKNRITIERQERIAEAAAAIEGMLPEAFKGDAHALLMAVYKDTSNPLPVRLEAARSAIPYEKPRLAAVEVSGSQEKPLTMQIVSGVPREQTEDTAPEHVNGHPGH